MPEVQNRAQARLTLILPHNPGLDAPGRRWLYIDARSVGVWHGPPARAAGAGMVRTGAFGGGCFLKALLTALLAGSLARRGIRVLEARQAPPNDGGVSLGQAWVAVCRMNPGD